MEGIKYNTGISQKKIHRIEEDIQYIKENIEKTQGPIFIELVGTPKSGKTTLLNSLKTLFSKENIPFEAKQDTAEYNPIEDKDIEEYNIWMIMELMKSLSEDLSDMTPRIIVYDRGILDRLPWINFSVNDGSIPERDAQIFKKLYETDFVKKYKPITYGFITSPELSVERKGKEGRLVNKKNVKLFNEYFSQELRTIKNNSTKINLVYTDIYQGEIKKYILDTTERLMEDIRSVILHRMLDKDKKATRLPESPSEEGR